MTAEPGAECPECSTRLEGDRCRCGWSPSRSSSAPACADCGARVAVQLDDDGIERCAACHVPYLRARAALDPISDEELARCRIDIASSLERLTRGVRGA